MGHQIVYDDAQARAAVNTEIPDNNSQLVKPVNVRRVSNKMLDAFTAGLLSAQTAIDESLGAVQLADRLGTYNAATGVYIVSETAATGTLVSTPAFSKGKYFDVIVEGTNSVTGTSRAWKIGDKVISAVTKWDALPFAIGDSIVGYSKLTDTLRKRMKGKNLLDNYRMVGVGTYPDTYSFVKLGTLSTYDGTTAGASPNKFPVAKLTLQAASGASEGYVILYAQGVNITALGHAGKQARLVFYFKTDVAVKGIYLSPRNNATTQGPIVVNSVSQITVGAVSLVKTAAFTLIDGVNVGYGIYVEMDRATYPNVAHVEISEITLRLEEDGDIVGTELNENKEISVYVSSISSSFTLAAPPNYTLIDSRSIQMPLGGGNALGIKWLSDWATKIVLRTSSTNKLFLNGIPLEMIINRVRVNGDNTYYISFSIGGVTYSGIYAATQPGLGPNDLVTVSFAYTGLTLEVTAYWNRLVVGSEQLWTANTLYSTISETVIRNYIDPSTLGFVPSASTRYQSVKLLDDLTPMVDIGNGGVGRVRHCAIIAPDIHEKWDAILQVSDIFKVSPAMIAKIPYMVVMGDITIGTRLRADTIAVLSGWATAIAACPIPVMACIGDHDFGNDTVNSSGVRNFVTHSLTKSDQRNYIIQPSINSLGAAAVIGAGVCYYYVDNAVSKVRYINLDERDQPMTQTSGVYDYDLYYAGCYQQTQLQWLADTALIVPASDWTIIINTHTAMTGATNITPVSAAYSLGDTKSAMWAILLSFKNRTAVNVSRAGVIPINVTTAFTSAIGNIACMTWGHTHQPDYELKDGIHIINFPNIGSYPSENGKSVLGTPTDSCVDFLVMDTISKDMRTIRYGRRGSVVVSGSVPLETKPNVTGHRFIDTPLTY